MRCSICGRKDCCGAQLEQEIDRLKDARGEAIEIIERLRKTWIERQYEWSAISWADKADAAGQIISALQETSDDS